VQAFDLVAAAADGCVGFGAKLAGKGWTLPIIGKKRVGEPMAGVGPSWNPGRARAKAGKSSTINSQIRRLFQRKAYFCLWLRMVQSPFCDGKVGAPIGERTQITLKRQDFRRFYSRPSFFSASSASCFDV
jgi:hypothetical protein